MANPMEVTLEAAQMIQIAINDAVDNEREACARLLDARGVASCEYGSTCPETGAFECSRLERGTCHCADFDEAAAEVRARKVRK